MSHPLALIVYNRSKHTKQVLDALRSQAPDPMYVFSDGAKDQVDAVNVTGARVVLSAINWTTPLETWQPTNIGLADSIIGAVDTVLERYETVIVLEDDCLPGPHFMAWMNKCLDSYKDDPGILAISGYTVNIPEHLRGGWDCYIMPRIETWGWATWREKWKLYERDVETALQRAKDKGVDLAQGGPDVPAMLEARARGDSQSWSPGWMLAAYLNEMYCVFPMVSHVQNIGTNGSGVHCGASERWRTAIAEEELIRLFASAEAGKLAHGQAIIDYVREYHAHY